MGLFGGLFRKGFEERRARGDRYREKGELGLALSEYEAALSRFEEGKHDAAAREDVVARLSEVRLALVEARLSEVRDLIESEYADEAEAELAAARDLGGEEHRGEQIAALASEIEALRQRLSGDDYRDPAEDVVFEQCLLSLPDQRAQAYRTLGAAFAEGIVALHEGDGERAAVSLRTALEERPDSSLVRLELGRALLFAEEPAEAVEHLRAYHEVAPEEPEAGYLVAEALASAGQGDASIDTLRAEVEKRPASARARLVLAEGLLGQQRWDDSIEIVQEALQLVSDPQASSTSWARGGSVSAALDASARSANAAEDAPPRIQLFRVLAQAHIGAGRTGDAIAPLEHVMKEHWRYDPDTGTLHFDIEHGWLLGRIYVERGERLERALELLHAVLTKLEGAAQVPVLGLIGRAHIAKGRKREARRYLEDAMELADGDAEATTRLGELMEGLA